MAVVPLNAIHVVANFKETQQGNHQALLDSPFTAFTIIKPMFDPAYMVKSNRRLPCARSFSLFSV